jgi:hypothetical protein
VALFNDGDVVLVLARVRKARIEDGRKTELRFIACESEGGEGFYEIEMPSGAVYCRLSEDPDNAGLVPALTWETFHEEPPR